MVVVFPVELSLLSLAVGLTYDGHAWLIFSVGSVVLGTPWLSHVSFVFLSWWGHNHVLMGGHVM